MKSFGDIARLAEAYAAARPFPHVVIDGFVDTALLEELVADFDEEPAERLQDEIFDVMASPAPPEGAAFRRFVEWLRSPAMLDAVSRTTGEVVRGAEVRAYAYLPGHYLLPHADSDRDGRRRVAFAFYVATLDGLRGGELDLYECELRSGVVVGARATRTIEPLPNRCVLFGVGETSLHRVREVTAGGRLSLAGWFTR
jgi:Rps23 Pro-64 3,4-dihydroxylase Tpa1-like proline 4-hydroxylase